MNGWVMMKWRRQRIKIIGIKENAEYASRYGIKNECGGIGRNTLYKPIRNNMIYRILTFFLIGIIFAPGVY